jgi:hypothetical protein
VIVRISTEGQYELPDGDVAALNELDNAAVSACGAGDESSFHDVFAKLLALVRGGRQLPDDELGPSDLILPPPDVSLEEASREFTGDGLIPG